MVERKHFLLSQLEERAPSIKWVEDVNHLIILRQRRIYRDSHGIGGMSVLHIGTPEQGRVILEKNESEGRGGGSEGKALQV